MILEAIVTTTNADGSPHLAPMGPRVDPGLTRFTLRPFPTSGTCRNLRERPEGVIHITDDALLIAKAALGAAIPLPGMNPAVIVNGFVLADTCRAFEFRVASFDDSTERVTIEVEVVLESCGRPFFGFNRGKHAVVEAAILATRMHLIPHAEIAAEFAKLRVIVDKTGGPAELEAMELLEERLAAEAAR